MFTFYYNPRLKPWITKAYRILALAKVHYTQSFTNDTGIIYLRTIFTNPKGKQSKIEEKPSVAISATDEVIATQGTMQ